MTDIDERNSKIALKLVRVDRSKTITVVCGETTASIAALFGLVGRLALLGLCWGLVEEAVGRLV